MIKEDQENNSKPCFTITDKQVFVNLHKAALEKASKVLKSSEGKLSSVLINTGISENGSDVADNQDDKKFLKMFGSKDKTYEVGVILQYMKFNAPSVEDVKKQGNDFDKAFRELNKDGIKKLHDSALNILKEYFKYFADTDVQESKMVEFIPEVQGEKTEIKDYKIIGVNFQDSKNDDKREEYFENIRNNKPLRVGFKFGYTLVFEGGK